MRKIRHENYLGVEQVQDEFRWIKSIRQIKNFIPSAFRTYSVGFSEELERFEHKNGAKKSERRRFEEHIFEFYQVKKKRSQVIFCWRETGVIFVVFGTING